MNFEKRIGKIEYWKVTIYGSHKIIQHLPSTVPATMVVDKIIFQYDNTTKSAVTVNVTPYGLQTVQCVYIPFVGSDKIRKPRRRILNNYIVYGKFCGNVIWCIITNIASVQSNTQLKN